MAKLKMVMRIQRSLFTLLVLYIMGCLLLWTLALRGKKPVREFEKDVLLEFEKDVVLEHPQLRRCGS